MGGLIVLVVGGLAAVLLDSSGDGNRGGGLGAGTGQPPSLHPGDVAGTPGVANSVELEAPEVLQEKAAAIMGSSTVLWPLEVDLRLERADHLPGAKDENPMGSGRASELVGRVADENGDPVAVTVKFVEGTNTGRTLRADSEGSSARPTCSRA